jgi:antitoxin YefM
MPVVEMPLAEVKHHLSEVVDRVERERGRVVITKNGRPAAVVLNVEDLESIEETLHVLGDPSMLAELRQALITGGERAPVVPRSHLRLISTTDR